MQTQKQIIINANQAVANIAYKTNEVFPIYPITPASEMSELVEQWSAENKTNRLNTVPKTFEMQSEAGVAGTMHGALQAGSLSSTFTSSQGLLLMLPNMYKIAGELTPNVIHVATRSIATHALSVFGDHSDIMACRQSGYAFLGSATVQEAQDFALIAQAATLRSRIPFVHFFDGFRTSHEINTIKPIADRIIDKMIDSELVRTHRYRALNPNAPVIRGTSQGPDVYFQSREAINAFYNACPDIVQKEMDHFKTLTGRTYRLFDYVGHSEAENIIVSMASSTKTIENTINDLNQKGAKIGLIKVRLFRPFSTTHLIKALPKSCKKIAVLDRTKEAGSTGEPLYLDVLQSLSEAFQKGEIEHLPRIIGGRYGLSSKAFTPGMVKAIYDNLKQEYPKNNFTVGIHDDCTGLSLAYKTLETQKDKTDQILFYHNAVKPDPDQLMHTLEILKNDEHPFVQSYTVCDYKKSNSRTVTHIRLGVQPINAPYLIERADFVVCQNAHFLLNDNVLKVIKPKGTLLVNSSQTSKAFWQTLSASIRSQIIEKEIKLYVVNSSDLSQNTILHKFNISSLQLCFLALKGSKLSLSNIKDHIYKVETCMDDHETQKIGDEELHSETLLQHLLTHNGNSVPVSLLPVDGTYNTNTSQFNLECNANVIPDWDISACTQCGACSMACPQAALRIKAYNSKELTDIPKTFKVTPSLEDDWQVDLLDYTIQINPDQCNGCNNCIDICPTKALTMHNDEEEIRIAKTNWTYFETLPELDRKKIDSTKVSQQQLQEPLYKYPVGVKGCGEAPYIKLMSQLFGDRLLVANATGASSIIGGALPTTPWAKNETGQGPAWSNSLFEDNAEFGLGFRLSLNNQKDLALNMLKALRPYLDSDLVYDIIHAKQTIEQEINAQRLRVERLKTALGALKFVKAKQLLDNADALVKKSVWIVGGDGWAYDIGFGGLDHVIASGENVNILVLDNEVYDNTGGQASKATPFGAKAKFAFKGKQKLKKDLGLYAMNYNNVYVASIAIGADQEQTLKAFNEAESFDGPSIIIAYTHSVSHGIDMKNPSQYHQAAVNSGQWLLYRHDPRNIKKGRNPLQLDSGFPNIKIKDYLLMENRFSDLFKMEPEKSKKVLRGYQNYIDQRYISFLDKATLMVKDKMAL